MIYRTILVVLIGLTLFGLYACDRENSVESPGLGGVTPVDTTPSDPPGYVADSLTAGNLLYVAAGGSGNGTDVSPFGSIQQAIDAAVLASGEHTIFVGTGTFNENLTLAPGVHLRGKRNPQADWEISNVDYTNVVGSALTGHSVAVIAQDLDQRTLLENLRIRSNKPSDPGASSVGIYAINSDSLTLVRCDVQAGAGGDGVAGIAGAVGANGQRGTVDDTLYGDPRCGGRGGQGAATCPDGVRNDGEQGFCYDGTQTGGIAGLGDTAADMTVRNGADGDTALVGEGGRAGVMAIVLDASPFPMFVIDSGITGLIGDSACGGGGGGGGPCWAWFDTLGYDTTGVDTIIDTLTDDTTFDTLIDTLIDTMYTGVENGGWGGWAGLPGHPGSGGTGAGSSVAIMLRTSTLLVEHVRLAALDGGTGGAGGDGGRGGSGGNGGNVTIPDPPDPWKPTRRVPNYAAGRGGRGGRAGDGGPGGGGTGGHSFSLVMYQSEVVSEREISYSFGPAGAGGASDQYVGPDGSSDSILVFP